MLSRLLGNRRYGAGTAGDAKWKSSVGHRVFGGFLGYILTDNMPRKMQLLH